MHTRTHVKTTLHASAHSWCLRLRGHECEWVRTCVPVCVEGHLVSERRGHGEDLIVGYVDAEGEDTRDEDVAQAYEDRRCRKPAQHRIRQDGLDSRMIACDHRYCDHDER